MIWVVCRWFVICLFVLVSWYLGGFDIVLLDCGFVLRGTVCGLVVEFSVVLIGGVCLYFGFGLLLLRCFLFGVSLVF